MQKKATDIRDEQIAAIRDAAERLSARFDRVYSLDNDRVEEFRVERDSTSRSERKIVLG